MATRLYQGTGNLRHLATTSQLSGFTTFSKNDLIAIHDAQSRSSNSRLTGGYNYSPHVYIPPQSRSATQLPAPVHTDAITRGVGEEVIRG